MALNSKNNPGDPAGVGTTGHEWDGLAELNNPLPRWWFWTFVATVVFAVVYMFLYPSVPWFNTHFPGVLGYSQRDTVDADVAALAARRAEVMNRLTATPLEQVRGDAGLHAVALTAGRIAYANNCQPCHGPGGEGRPGYPALAGDAWIWGGSLEAIQTTVTWGIRNSLEQARQSQMPRFGVDGLLKPAEIDLVTDYVMGLYGKPVQGRDAGAGATIYADNCAACHGEKGEGNRELGAPTLSDSVQLYGNTRAAVRAQIVNPRQGVMPAWNTRLDEATIRAVTLYVHSLGGGE